MSRPSISVIIPTYNRPNKLSRALSSVISQSYENLEVIVVDDHSVTDTLSVIEGFCDDRLKYISHDINKGSQQARNTGISSAKGDYIALLDDDDTWLPDKLELQLELMEDKEDIGLVYCGCYDVLESDNSIIKIRTPEFRGDVHGKILERNILASPTPLIKREVFDIAGPFDITLPSCQDWDMWIRIAQHYEFDYVDRPLAKFYFHGNQISVNMEKRVEGRQRLVEKHKDKMDRRTLAEHYHWLGVNYMLLGHKENAKRFEKEAIRLDPSIRFIFSRFLFNIGVGPFRAVMRTIGRIYDY